MTTIANRPLATVKAQAPLAKPAANAAAPVALSKPALTNTMPVAPTKPAFTNTMPVALQPVGMVVPIFTKVFQHLSQGGIRFTPPVIVDVIKSSVRSGFGLQNLAWTAVPSAFRNVKDAFQGKQSAARAAANVTTETGFGVVRGIVAGIVVQSASIAAGPLLGLLPANPMLMMGASIAISIGGMIGTNMLVNNYLKKSGIQQAVSDKLTELFGGDKPPAAAPAAAPAPAKA
jgi:hypothetical protein